MILSHNKIYSGFEKIISGVPQSSIVGPIMFNAFLNDLFRYTENRSAHNFTDNTTLSWFPKKHNDPINLLTIFTWNNLCFTEFSAKVH